MKSTFDQLLGPLGYSFDDILGVTRLEDLFWSSNTENQAYHIYSRNKIARYGRTYFP